MPTLSICIPTHDGRAAVLDRLLSDLEGQLVPGVRERVEVCVSDNGSRDATTAVLDRHRVNLPLVTHRFERNDGFTPNLLAVVEIASGDFCWLLGSDDLVAEGGVAAVLGVLDAHPDVAGITLNRYRVNVFDPATKHLDPPEELPADGVRQHVYVSAHEAFAEVGLLHDYISTQVVSRALWAEAVGRTAAAELVTAKHFAHLLLLGRVVQRTPRWVWHPSPLVQHTTGTSALDEDLDNDWTSYQLAVMDGRDTVWAMLFGRRSPTYKAVMAKAWLRSARPTPVVDLKRRPKHTDRSDVALAVAFTRWFWWYPPFWRHTAPVLLIPQRVVKRMQARRERLAQPRR